jgi:hypothetical protein
LADSTFVMSVAMIQKRMCDAHIQLPNRRRLRSVRFRTLAPCFTGARRKPALADRSKCRPRVSMSTRGEPPSYARRGPSREGLARPSAARGWQVGWQVPSAERTLPGFPCQRVGSRRATLGADHRGKVWKPSQGFHVKLVQTLQVPLRL